MAGGTNACVCGCPPEAHDPECSECDDCVHYEEADDGFEFFV